MDSRPGLRTTSPSSGTRTGLSNTRTLPPDPLLESAGRTWWAFGIRQPDRDYPVPIVETESFLNLEPAPAVRMNQPFGLFCSAWRVLEPFRLECVRIPPVRAGKNGRIIRIVIFCVPSVFSGGTVLLSGSSAPRKIVDEFILLKKQKSQLLFRSLSMPVMK